METTVQRLRYVLDVLAPTVAGMKATLPILQNVVVGQGRAWATNLETAVTVEFPEATDDPVLLPNRQVLSLLRTIPGPTRLSINREGNAIKLAAGATSADFPVSGEVADFPPLPKLEPIGEGSVDADLFLKTATAVAKYAATEASRPALQCVCVTLGDPVEMAGADGFQLAWQAVPIQLAAPDGMSQLLLPTTAAHTLARVWKLMEKQPTVDGQVGADPLKQDGGFQLAMLAVAKRMATIRFTRTALSFQHGAVTVLVQLTQEDFPNYHQLIPTDLPNKVSFDPEEALRAVRSLAEVAADGSGIVRLNWAGDRLEFSGHADKVGAITASIRAHIQGEEARIAFNIRYLTEYLQGKLGMVLLETSAPSSPGRFYSNGSPDVLIMPLFVSDTDAPATEPAVDQPAVGGPAAKEAPEQPPDDQQPPVDEGTLEEPASAAAPPAKSKRPRRRK